MRKSGASRASDLSTSWSAARPVTQRDRSMGLAATMGRACGAGVTRTLSTQAVPAESRPHLNTILTAAASGCLRPGSNAWT